MNIKKNLFNKNPTLPRCFASGGYPGTLLLRNKKSKLGLIQLAFLVYFFTPVTLNVPSSFLYPEILNLSFSFAKIKSFEMETPAI